VYIKINLLPAELRPKKTLIQFDLKAALFLAVVAAVVVLGGWYFILMREAGTYKSQLTQIKNEEAGLRETVALQAEVNALKKKVIQRVEIIRQLTADSDVRFDMLKHINGIIPENLWLLNINENNQSGKTAFNIEGMSYTKKDISKFLDALQRYKKFSSVALESISPMPLESRDAFQFIVKVELPISSPAEDTEKKEKKTGAATAPANKPAGKS
jgi:Tfp pilus assembly protein PilN